MLESHLELDWWLCKDCLKGLHGITKFAEHKIHTHKEEDTVDNIKQKIIERIKRREQRQKKLEIEKESAASSSTPLQQNIDCVDLSDDDIDNDGNHKAKEKQEPRKGQDMDKTLDSSNASKAQYNNNSKEKDDDGQELRGKRSHKDNDEQAHQHHHVHKTKSVQKENKSPATDVINQIDDEDLKMETDDHHYETSKDHVAVIANNNDDGVIKIQNERKAKRPRVEDSSNKDQMKSHNLSTKPNDTRLENPKDTNPPQPTSNEFAKPTSTTTTQKTTFSETQKNIENKLNQIPNGRKSKTELFKLGLTDSDLLNMTMNGHGRRLRTKDPSTFPEDWFAPPKTKEKPKKKQKPILPSPSKSINVQPTVPVIVPEPQLRTSDSAKPSPMKLFLRRESETGSYKVQNFNESNNNESKVVVVEGESGEITDPKLHVTKHHRHHHQQHNILPEGKEEEEEEYIPSKKFPFVDKTAETKPPESINKLLKLQVPKLIVKGKQPLVVEKNDVHEKKINSSNSNDLQQLFVCSCTKKFRAEESFIEHRNKVHKENLKTTTVKSVPLAKKLKQKKKHTKANKIKNIIVSSNITVKSYDCKICKNRYLTKEDLLEHLENYHMGK